MQVNEWVENPLFGKSHDTSFQTQSCTDCGNDEYLVDGTTLCELCWLHTFGEKLPTAHCGEVLIWAYAYTYHSRQKVPEGSWFVGYLTLDNDIACFECGEDLFVDLADVSHWQTFDVAPPDKPTVDNTRESIDDKKLAEAEAKLVEKNSDLFMANAEGYADGYQDGLRDATESKTDSPITKE